MSTAKEKIKLLYTVKSYPIGTRQSLAFAYFEDFWVQVFPLVHLWSGHGLNTRGGDFLEVWERAMEKERVHVVEKERINVWRMGEIEREKQIYEIYVNMQHMLHAEEYKYGPIHTCQPSNLRNRDKWEEYL